MIEDLKHSQLTKNLRDTEAGFVHSPSGNSDYLDSQRKSDSKEHVSEADEEPRRSNSMSERRNATEEEMATLRHVADRLPLAVWLVIFGGAAERFTYYALTTPWRMLSTLASMQLLTDAAQRTTCKTLVDIKPCRELWVLVNRLQLTFTMRFLSFLF